RSRFRASSAVSPSWATPTWNPSLVRTCRRSSAMSTSSSTTSRRGVMGRRYGLVVSEALRRSKDVVTCSAGRTRQPLHLLEVMPHVVARLELLGPLEQRHRVLEPGLRHEELGVPEARV